MSPHQPVILFTNVFNKYVLKSLRFCRAFLKQCTVLVKITEGYFDIIIVIVIIIIIVNLSCFVVGK